MTSEVIEPSKEKAEVPPSLGCDHYQRKCAFISPCCKNEYICRLCHDGAELHEIDRKKVEKIKCLVCNKVQKVQGKCEDCEIKFGNYFCEICRLYDDTDKGQFHCEPCGICRVGGRDQYYHCDTCDICLALTMKGNHKCIEKATRANCPICMEDLHSSRIACHIPECGHYLHRECYAKMLKTGNYTCPICNQSMVNMAVVWEKMDEEVAGTPMPDAYKNYHVYILCRDCHKESKVLFHVIGLKCLECGSYNTCRSEGPEGAAADELPADLAVELASDHDSDDTDEMEDATEHMEEEENDEGDHESDGASANGPKSPSGPASRREPGDGSSS